MSAVLVFSAWRNTVLSFKRTVSRDLLLQVFYVSALPKPPIILFHHFNLKKNSWKILATEGAAPVSMTLVINGEMIQRRYNWLAAYIIDGLFYFMLNLRCRQSVTDQ